VRARPSVLDASVRASCRRTRTGVKAATMSVGCAMASAVTTATTVTTTRGGVKNVKQHQMLMPTKTRRGSTMRRRSSTGSEPEWKVRQREQDAAISAEEDAVRGRVAELLKPILANGASSSASSESSSSSSASATRSALAGKIAAATSALESGLIERETEVRLLLLAACCGEHLLLLGPPGTAKSELGRRLSALCEGGSYFERLLTRFSVPEELFGPLSMKGLENDQYVRQIDGYLPTANVAFVDEVFKANSAILNSLLTILNERLFDNGNERIDVPLLCMVGASNELPESEELDALYDRFLLRSSVEQVSSAGLSKLLSLGGAAAIGSKAGDQGGIKKSGEKAVVLKPEDFANIRYEAAETTKVPTSVIELISDLRTFLQEKCEPPVYVSDRRLLKAVQLLRVAAYTNDRAEVSEFDTLLLTNVLWQRPSEAVVIKDWILERLAQDRGTKQVQYLLAGLFGRACRADGDAEECKQLLKEAKQLREVLTSQLGALRGTQGGSLPALREHLWLSPTDAARAAQTLGPMFSKVSKSLEKLLEDTLTLEVALERDTEPHILALLMPEYWAAFIREGPISDVQPLGVSNAP
jgi:MoxR-like ATPase